jgi:tetratricopeptide (TPR) repeat protein
MTTHSWQHLQSLFRDVIERPADEREAYMAQRCGGNEAVARELRNLIAAHEQAGAFMAAPAWQTAGTPAPEPRADDQLEGASLLGRTIGQYRLEKVIASGGMGIVFQAAQEHPHRTVALKVMRSGLPSRAALRRFEFEVEVLGRLHHPAIAQIFEAGTFESDAGLQPFFAMELVEGLPVTEYAAARRLGTAARLALFISICQGVDHAHHKGVIHRDLKPANILVIESPNAQPKILDFGIARAIGTNFKTASLATDAGSLLGTLAYMSPEQVAGDAGEVDTRSDIYVLGVLLYELLTGRMPHADLARQSVPEAVRTVREDDPPPLSSVNRVLRGDLEWITMKAMEKDRSRRYGSASELAADVARHLNHEPVLAGPPSALYRFSKLIKRHRTAAMAVVLVCVSTLGGLAATTAMYLQMRQQRDLALRQTQIARDAESEANQLFMQAVTIGHGFGEFAESELSNLAGGTKTRLRLAERSLAEVLSLYQQRPNPEMAYGLAYSHQRVGEAQAVMGRSAEALRSHLAAFELRLQGAADRPDSESIVRALAVGHWRVADAQVLLGMYQQALEHHLLSRAIHQQRNQRWQETLDPVMQGVYMGIAHRRIAEMEYQLNHPAAALENFRHSLTLVDAGLARESQNIELLRGRALVLRGLGEVEATLGMHREALEHLADSVATLERLARTTGPSNVYERTNQARAHLIMVAVHAALDRPDQAQGAAQTALGLAEALAGADPDNYESQQLLGRALIAAASAALLGGRAEQPQRAAARAATLLETLAQFDPENARVRRDLAVACLTLANAMEAEGNQSQQPADAPAWRERGRSILRQLRDHQRLAPIDEPLLDPAS